MSSANQQVQKKYVCAKSDGLPILDHDMMKIYVIAEQKYLLLKSVLRRLITAVQEKNVITVKAMLSLHRRGKLFPWQNEAWPSEPEMRDLVIQHVIAPHYRLYRNEMAERYKERLPALLKVETAFNHLIGAIENRDSKRVWKLVNRWTK